MANNNDHKEVFSKSDNFNIVFDYVPKEFPQIVSEPAETFVQGSEGKASEFEMSDLVAQQSGVAALKKKGIEEQIEAETLKRLKEVEESAYKEAYDLGLVEGTEKAFAERREEFKERLAHMDRLIHDLETVKQRMISDNEGEIVKMVNQIASRVAFREIESDPKSVLFVLQELISEVESEDTVTVRLAPQDFDFVEKLRQEDAKDVEFMKKVKVEASDEVQPGGCVLETNFGTIDARLEERVRKVWESLSQKLPQWREEESSDGRSGSDQD